MDDIGKDPRVRAGRAGRSSSPVLVLVERNEFLRKRLRGWITAEFSGCEYHEAQSLDGVGKLLATVSPHVVLVDIDVPGGRGFEILRLLQEKTPAATLIALSIYQTAQARDYAADTGAIMCTSMTLLDATLRTVVGGLFGRAPAEPPRP